MSGSLPEKEILGDLYHSMNKSLQQLESEYKEFVAETDNIDLVLCKCYHRDAMNTKHIDEVRASVDGFLRGQAPWTEIDKKSSANAEYLFQKFELMDKKDKEAKLNSIGEAFELSQIMTQLRSAYHDRAGLEEEIIKKIHELQELKQRLNDSKIATEKALQLNCTDEDPEIKANIETIIAVSATVKDICDNIMDIIKEQEKSINLLTVNINKVTDTLKYFKHTM